MMRSKQENDNKPVRTGIRGMDELIDGGMRPNTLNLVTGTYGTGRTIFALQYLYHGAKNGEPGVYVSLEKDPEDLIKTMEGMGWGVRDLLKKKHLSIIKPELHKFDMLKQTVEDEVDRIGAKRIVIKPFSLIAAYFNNVYDTRRALFDLRREMEKLKCTGIVITDAMAGDVFSNVAEFVANSVIILDIILKKETNSYVRTVNVRKMEGAEHLLKLVPLEIKKGGIIVYPDAEVF